MAGKEGKKKGGMRKIGRSKRKGLDQVLSNFVRNKITAQKYFKAKGLVSHHNYIKKTTLA